MIDRERSDDGDFEERLSPELRMLHRELSGIRIEERPSFAPELEAELARSWRSGRASRRSAWPRLLLAASLAGVMVAGVSVPAARGAVARVVRAVLHEAAPALFPPAVEPQLPEIRVAEPPELPAEASTRTTISPPAVREAEDPPVREEIPWNAEYSIPQILHRQEAEALIASFYPLALQRAGVGGAVRLMLWVDTEGQVDHVQMRESSGYQSLDLAAMRAARDLRFISARRAGRPVGTWVEFVVHFVPPPGEDGQSSL